MIKEIAQIMFLVGLVSAFLSLILSFIRLLLNKVIIAKIAVGMCLAGLVLVIVSVGLMHFI